MLKGVKAQGRSYIQRMNILTLSKESELFSNHSFIFLHTSFVQLMDRNTDKCRGDKDRDGFYEKVIENDDDTDDCSDNWGHTFWYASR